MQQSPGALVYQCRKERLIGAKGEAVDERLPSRVGSEGRSSFEMSIKRESSLELSTKPEINYSAQRKVAHALMMMVCNETMIVHFINKGGVEAVLKLINESKLPRRFLYFLSVFVVKL
jgi:hypothetical protein